MKKFIFPLFLAFLGFNANAQWISGGNGQTYTFGDIAEVSNGAVISVSDNNYKVLQDITISVNDVLHFDETLQTVTIGDDILITVQGSITSAERNDKALLTGISEENPNGHFNFIIEDAIVESNVKNIIFENGNGFKLNDSPAIIDNCEFRYFEKDFSTSVIHLFNSHPTIKNCYIHNNQGPAISSGANIQCSPKIINNVLYNNVLSNTNTPQINLGPGHNDTVYIVGNRIEGVASTMSGGIAIANLMNIGNTKAVIAHNTIINNRYGYTQNGPNVESFIYNNIFKDNNLEVNPMNGGSGISIYGSDPTCKATIRNNVITGNLWGITAIYYHTIDLGTAEDHGNNSFFDNGNNGETYALYNNANNDISAIGNYWGSNDPDFAETVIFHQPDQSNLGLVTYQPTSEIHPIIRSFSILAANNPSISEDILGNINEEENTISINLPSGISPAGLIPTYTTDLGVSCTPESGTEMDFSAPVTISLTTPHGDSQEWVVTVVNENLIGDANGDGQINVLDIQTIVSYLLNQESQINIENADVNEDGVINILDIMLIVNTIV